MLGYAFVFFILLVTITRMTFVPFEVLRVMAAFGSCFTLLKLFDWLRLFEETAFYVLLVQETIKDIKYFILLLITTLMMFGVPLLMLDANSADDKELIDKSYNMWLLDLL